MSIPAHARSNFQTMLRTAGDGNLALMVICAVGGDEDDYVFTPFGHLADGNPYDAYLPPDPDDPEGFVQSETGEAP